MPNNHPRNLDRDYRDPLSRELDPSLWEDNGYVTKETLMSFFGLYAFRTNNSKNITNWKEDVDSVHTYYQNSYGYRDREYSGGSELIAAGCSQTFGQGIHEEARWSSLLGDHLNLKTATLAVPGWSTQAAISSVMHHIKTYGKPKVVALLLPDFTRFDTILNTNYTTKSNYRHDAAYPVQLTGVNRYKFNADIPKFERRPYPIDSIINGEASYFAAGQSLAHFREYCRESGISFLWGTWDFKLDYLVRYVRDLVLTGDDIFEMQNLGITKAHLPYLDFSDYVDMGFFYREDGWVDDFQKYTCHQELRDKYGDCCFNIGTDRQEHMGVHMHAHIADKFFSKINEN